MIVICPTLANAGAGFGPAWLQFGRTQYQVVRPESSFLSVAPGAYLAIPLYDGQLVPLRGSQAVLRFLGTASAPVPECIRIADRHAMSNRMALFRAIGNPGEGGVVQVRLRLPELHEPCMSCRTVHFFVRVGRGTTRARPRRVTNGD